MNNRTIMGEFKWRNKTVYLRSKPTQYVLDHEMHHVRQYLALSEEKYRSQGVLKAEEHVFELIMRDRIKYSSEELVSADRYIRMIRAKAAAGLLREV